MTGVWHCGWESIVTAELFGEFGLRGLVLGAWGVI